MSYLGRLGTQLSGKFLRGGPSPLAEGTETQGGHSPQHRCDVGACMEEGCALATVELSVVGRQLAAVSSYQQVEGATSASDQEGQIQWWQAATLPAAAMEAGVHRPLGEATEEGEGEGTGPPEASAGSAVPPPPLPLAVATAAASASALSPLSSHRRESASDLSDSAINGGAYILPSGYSSMLTPSKSSGVLPVDIVSVGLSSAGTNGMLPAFPGQQKVASSWLIYP